MIKAYSKFLDILEKIQRIILTVSVPGMVLIMFYQVVMRYVFHNSPAWSEELVRYGYARVLGVSEGYSGRQRHGV